MKKLIVALMVLSTLASCGKDNKVASPVATAPTSTSPVTTAITTADAVGVELGKKVDAYNVQFGAVAMYQGMSYNEIVARGGILKFKYTKSAAAASNCETKWGFITICSGSTSSSNITTSREVANATDSTTVIAKLNELKAIINKAHPMYKIQTNGSIYYIYTVEGKTFAIDTRVPVTANPVGIRQADGSAEYLYSIPVTWN